jgi:hypothetical protein
LNSYVITSVFRRSNFETLLKVNEDTFLEVKNLEMFCNSVNKTPQQIGSLKTCKKTNTKSQSDILDCFNLELETKQIIFQFKGKEEKEA